MKPQSIIVDKKEKGLVYYGRVFTNTGLKIPKFSTETEREKKADTRFEDFNPVFANTML